MATEGKAKAPSRASATSSPAPSAEEIARRRRVFVETFKLRDAIGPIDMTTEELLSDEDEGDA